MLVDGHDCPSLEGLEADEAIQPVFRMQGRGSFLKIGDVENDISDSTGLR
jgi:hypothetical protein